MALKLLKTIFELFKDTGHLHFSGQLHYIFIDCSRTVYGCFNRIRKTGLVQSFTLDCFRCIQCVRLLSSSVGVILDVEVKKKKHKTTL